MLKAALQSYARRRDTGVADRRHAVLDFHRRDAIAPSRDISVLVPRGALTGWQAPIGRPALGPPSLLKAALQS